MNQARFLFLPALFLLLAGLLGAAPVITLSTDRATARYACGETVTFTLEATDDGARLPAGVVRVKLSVAGGKVLLEESFDLAQANPVRFSGTLAEPGFLLAAASDLPGAKTALAGAGFEPEKIAAGHEVPADFSSFWAEGRAAIADKPVKLEKLDAYSTDAFTSYAVTVEVLHGEQLRGFLSIPTGKGPFPAVVIIPGAGPGYVEPFTNWAKRGVIALTMNVHKYPVILGDAAANKAQYDERLAKLYYPRDQAANRDTYHFRNVILGIDRAINELAARPEWDHRHLVMDGSSQGGGLSLILAGFNPHVTAAAANVPALCDHGGVKLGRQPGWPGLSSAGERALEVSAYYDVANFARSIRGPVLVSAGFIDVTCPPASVYAAWNRIPGSEKRMLDLPTVGHAVVAQYTSVKDPWVETQLGRRPSARQ